jgi:hypothetical protein
MVTVGKPGVIGVVVLSLTVLLGGRSLTSTGTLD